MDRQVEALRALMRVLPCHGPEANEAAHRLAAEALEAAESGEKTDTREEKIEKFCDILAELLETYRAKNADYGDSFGATYRKFGLVSAVVRMSDKLSRLETLMTRSAHVDESVRDTLLDLAAYAIMTAIEFDRQGRS